MKAKKSLLKDKKMDDVFSLTLQGGFASWIVQNVVAMCRVNAGGNDGIHETKGSEESHHPSNGPRNLLLCERCK